MRRHVLRSKKYFLFPGAKGAALGNKKFQRYNILYVRRVLWQQKISLSFRNLNHFDNVDVPAMKSDDIPASGPTRRHPEGR